jgi:alpha-amylase
MKRMLRNHCSRLLLLFSLLTAQSSFAQSSYVHKAVFQAFWWDYWNSNFPNGWSNYLTELAPRLKEAGFDAIWIPPSYKNSSTGSVGYGPFDNYDLGDKYQKGGGSLNVRTRMGTKDEFLRMIAVMHANGIEVIQDVVLNHNDGAGTNTGSGGQDTETSYSMQSSSGYKNFRYTSYATPLLDDSQNDYWTRSGRWCKNYPNYYPNLMNNCNTGDICSAYFGPDISYESTAYGQSSNIPTSGSVTISGTTRNYYNPAQTSNYMRDNARNWLLWLKKQTGVDGWRWDAVKHFPVNVQEDLIYNSKYTAGFASGGQDMFCVGEWIGNASALDAYVTSVQTGSAPGGISNEKHTGTFDFSYRGYGSNGGIYSMVLSSGSYNMQNLPSEQQSQRYMDYGSKRVYRTVPFVNSHDTYRPKLDANGNFLKSLGDNTGWDTGNELGGNGQHLDPREPRLAAAYAAIAAIDGNPCFFFEDVFDIGTTGKRWSHLPTSTTDLPSRSDLINILRAHQKLGFKKGAYAVPTALTGASAPYYQSGSSGNHIVFERVGKAVIGITDKYNTASNNTADEEVWVTVNTAWANKDLYDYSGAHGTAVTHVYSDSRVLIKTAPVGHTISGANGHGYSIWAPAPTGVTISSVNDLYNYLATYVPARSAETVQEWEMANDLGDSHCSSLGQGGALPSNSTNQRVAGKIYAKQSTNVTVKIYPEVDGRNLTFSLWDLYGNKLYETSGTSTNAAPLTGTYSVAATGWIAVKVRNTNTSQAGQKCWVNVTYTAPAVVNTRTTADSAYNKVAIWTGNKGTSDASDCGNWEEGLLPQSKYKAMVPANPATMPVVATNINAQQLVIETGAGMVVNSGKTINVTGNVTNNGTLTCNGTLKLSGTSAQSITGKATIGHLSINNNAGVNLSDSLWVKDSLSLLQGTLVTGNKLVLRSTAINQTAIIPAVGSGAGISGNVTVERYIPQSRRAFRDITPCVNNGSQTLFNTWQEGGVNTNGYGTQITGSKGVAGSIDPATGFDKTSTGSQSLFSYQISNTGTATWVAATSTNKAADTLSAFRPYRISIRGNRQNDLSVDNTLMNAPVILRSTGRPFTGSLALNTSGITLNGVTNSSFKLNAASDGFTLVANPYICPLDWHSVFAASTNMNAAYMVWDPLVATTGAYVTYSQATGLTNMGTSAVGRYIQPGQGFFVRNNGTAPQLNIQEAHKAFGAGNFTAVFRSNGVVNPVMKLSLLKVSANDTTIADGAVVAFDNAFAAAVDATDAGKISNPANNLAFVNNNTSLSIEARPLPSVTDTLPVKVWSLTDNTAYVLKADLQQMAGTTVQPYLQDLYSNTLTPLPTGDTRYYNFTVNNADAATFNSRFRIVFTNATLPVRFISINAAAKEKDIQLTWKVDETDMAAYEVQHSLTGTAFTTLATIKSANAGSYNWLHVQPGVNQHYYRIKAISRQGAVQYSSIVAISLSGQQPAMALFPNPVTDKRVQFKVTNLPPAAYNIVWYNTNGQLVFNKAVQHQGNAGVYSITLPQAVSKGVYRVMLCSNETVLLQTTVLVN